MLATRFSRRVQLAPLRRLTIRSRNSTYQPPETPKSPPNRHREFYKTFGRPIAKNFLIALVTYQVLYWSWAKLESIEFKKERQDEIQSLEGELKSLTKGRSPS